MTAPAGSGALLREQKARWAKRVLLAPFGRLVLRRARDGRANGLRALAVRRLAFPYLRAADLWFERDMGYGVFGASTTDMLPMYVYVFGTWEPNLSDFVKSRLVPGDVFVDVGANTGWFTILAASLVAPGGHVVAVEAAPVIADALEAQIVRNGLENVRVVREAVSDHTGHVGLRLGPAENTGATAALRGDSPDAVHVPCRPLGDMLTPDERARVRLIKIDVEGAEFAAVRGLSPLLDSVPEGTELVIEIGPQRAGSLGELEELFEILARRGYFPYVMPNSYDIRDCLEHVPVRRLDRLRTGDLTEQADIVFSRVDAPALSVNEPPTSSSAVT